MTCKCNEFDNIIDLTVDDDDAIDGDADDYDHDHDGEEEGKNIISLEKETDDLEC